MNKVTACVHVSLLHQTKPLMSSSHDLHTDAHNPTIKKLKIFGDNRLQKMLQER